MNYIIVVVVVVFVANHLCHKHNKCQVYRIITVR